MRKFGGRRLWVAGVTLGVAASLAFVACSPSRTEQPRPTALSTPPESPASQPASPSPVPLPRGTTCTDGPQLSFVATATGREQIYRLGTNPSADPRRIVELPGMVADPAWSPDGQLVAFRWYRSGRSRPDVYVANADGSHLRLLVRKAAMPAWSPDGRSVAFANLRSGSRGISVVDVADALRGEGIIRIVTQTGDDIPEEQPAWSPDGDRIAFSSQRDGTTDVWVVSVDGSHLRNLTPRSFALDEGPTWSPDGDQIAFGSTRSSSSDLGGDVYVMRSDGRNVRRLTFEDSAYAPAWSPDGCGIAFNSRISGTSQIYVMRPDGGGVGQVTTSYPDANGDPTIACCAAWRP